MSNTDIMGDLISEGGKLVGENEKLRIEIAALLRENERLRVALQPFANLAEGYLSSGGLLPESIPITSFVAAKAALEGNP